MSDDEHAELIEYAKRGVAREHGIDERDAHRLSGRSLAELHADARAFQKEVGGFDPSERARDDGGRFASGGDMNTILRRAAGRT